MTFLPMDLIVRRVETNGADSDVLKFTELLYAGELALRLTTAAFVAAVEDDIDSHRYRLLHTIVRADGIGDWVARLDEVLSGPASQHLSSAMFDDRRVFNERVGKGSWQFEAFQLLNEVLHGIQPATPQTPAKVTLRAWFAKFAELRNKTRGHGATTPATCARYVSSLERSVYLIVSENPVFNRSWAYLHRNLSGRYKVAALGGDQNVFAKLKTVEAAAGNNYPNGVYMWADRPRLVELVYTDLNISDFAMPNGAFTGDSFELLSLISDRRSRADAAPYLATAADRPASETEGRSELDIVGNVFANLPVPPSDYIQRPGLEREVGDALLNDRHPIVTLVGRGGIGKTSVALTIAHEIAKTERYAVILWFSARDVDLTPSGPKIVKPRVLTEKMIAEQYQQLISGLLPKDENADALGTMARHLRDNPNGPTLYIFDNFETVRSPVDLFQWLDAQVRLPNKIVITSRFREFKADYPIEVGGMENKEARLLIDRTLIRLAASVPLDNDAIEQIIEESDGHPYVIKIILGELAASGSFGKPSRLLVKRDDILDALFERTYSNLSPMAVHVFLTLSSWRSLIPQIAVQAVLLRHSSEGGNPEKAIDELVRMSLVERVLADDGSDFLSVPLTAALFGKKKLEVSAHRDEIESDVRFLQDIGVTVKSGLKEGVRPRIVTFFRRAARRIEEKTADMEELRPVLEFVARGYYPAWVLLAELELEVGGANRLHSAADYMRRFLEARPSPHEAQDAWQKLIGIYQAMNDVRGACNAFLRAAETSAPGLEQISYMANRLNSDRDIMEGTDVADRRTLFAPLAGLMEQHLPRASATDLSRLAWLHLHAGDQARARDMANLGLAREPDHIHCQRLVDKLAL